MASIARQLCGKTSLMLPWDHKDILPHAVTTIRTAGNAVSLESFSAFHAVARGLAIGVAFLRRKQTGCASRGLDRTGAATFMLRHINMARKTTAVKTDGADIVVALLWCVNGDILLRKLCESWMQAKWRRRSGEYLPARTRWRRHGEAAGELK